jgi:hypothetical protein
MIWSVQDLAKWMRDSGKPSSVLYVGFEGGSTLLGHSSTAGFFQGLCDPIDGTFRDQDIRNGWTGLLADQRRLYFEEHTKANRPDSYAIVALAALLKREYFKAIVMTDPNATMPALLTQHEVQVQHFDCATQRAGVLRGYSGAKLKHPIIVDAADLILDGLDPSYRGLASRREGDPPTRDDLHEMREALRGFSATFEWTFVWDWCPYNVVFEKVCRPRDGHLFALGEYTNSKGMGDWPPRYVHDGDRGGEQSHLVNTRILVELGRLLEPEGLKKGAKAPRPRAEALHFRQIPQRRSCLLWPEEVLRNILTQNAKPEVRIVIVGAGGPVVRSLVVSRLLEELDGGSADSRWRRYDDLDTLRSAVDLFTEVPGPPLLVAEIGGEIGDTEAAEQSIVSAVSGWASALARAERRLLLLAPTQWSAVANRHLSGLPQIWCTTLWPQEGAKEIHLERWLSTLPGLSLRSISSDGAPEEALSELARRMLRWVKESVAMVNGRVLDHLHDALDHWAYSVRTGAGAIEQREGGYSPPDLDFLESLWRQTFQRSRVDRVGRPDDFSLGAVRRLARPAPEGGETGEDRPEPPTPESAEDEFELGGIRKRQNPPEESGDDGDDGDAEPGPPAAG